RSRVNTTQSESPSVAVCWPPPLMVRDKALLLKAVGRTSSSLEKQSLSVVPSRDRMPSKGFFIPGTITSIQTGFLPASMVKVASTLRPSARGHLQTQPPRRLRPGQPLQGRQPERLPGVRFDAPSNPGLRLGQDVLIEFVAKPPHQVV